MKAKQAYALNYYYGRALGSYGYEDLDNLSDIELHEFKMGYDFGVSDYCMDLDDNEEEENGIY
jgi:hypothetical protein